MEEVGRTEAQIAPDEFLGNSEWFFIKMCIGTRSLGKPAMGMIKFLCVSFPLCY